MTALTTASRLIAYSIAWRTATSFVGGLAALTRNIVGAPLNMLR